MTVDLVNSDGSHIVLGEIPYDQNTYETQGGLVTLSLSNHPQLAEIKSADTTSLLAIHSTTLNQDVLVESAGLDIQTEDRALYFDAQTLSNWDDPNEKPIPGTSQVTLNVFRQGKPVQTAATVNLEYSDVRQGADQPQ